MKHYSGNAVNYPCLSAALAIVILCVFGSHAQTFNQDPGHKEYLSVNGVKFSSPKGFDAQRLTTNEKVAYVPHEKYDLGLLVAVAEGPMDAEYTEGLASLAASHLFPKEKEGYSWKKLDGYEKVSKYEVGGGMLQGFNGHQRVVMQYRQLKVGGKDIVVGYSFGLGRGNEAKVLFDRNLGGDSMPGWYAQAHVIASITGEKYIDINPGTSVIAAPPPGLKN